MKILIPLFLSVFIFSGCAATVLQKPNAEMIPVLMENTKKLASISIFQITYLKSILGSDIGKVSVESVQCMDSIIEIVKKVAKEKRDYTDEELGLIAGKWDRIIFLIGVPAVQDLIKFISVL